MSNTQPPELALSPCERAQETIFSQIEAEPVSLADQAFLASHLETCGDCQAYQQSMSHLSDSLGEMEDVPVPVGLADWIMARIADESTTLQTPVVVGGANRFHWRKYTSVAAAALLLAVAIPLVLKGVSPNEPASNRASQSNGRTVAMQSETSDELILRQAQQKPTQVQNLPNEETPKVQPQQGGRDQKSRLSVTESNVVAQAPKKKATNVPAQPVRQARPSKVVIAETHEVDGTQLAYAGAMNLQEAYASDSESDVYYDPVSTLVGF